MEMRIQTSEDTFRSLREKNAYYIDKTEMIEEFLTRHFDRAVLFTRPRRFGKSLTMTMFREFLDIRQNSRDIFKGLKVMEYPDLVRNYLNQYPVIFLSLKEVSGLDYESILDNFKFVMANLCKSFDGYNDTLLNDEKVNEFDKNIFRKIENQEANQANTVAVLEILSRMLCTHYNKKVFVIIDEYDVPMARVYGTDAYEKVQDMIERMLSYVCKTNNYVETVLLSGCLYTVKNSIYTGLNNIKPYTVLSPIFSSSIGFSDMDIRKLLADANLPELYDTVAEWYDGYIFGREKMYCPWDVLSFVQSKLDGSYSETFGPKSYWVNTSSTSLDLIHGFLGKTSEANKKFEQLLAGYPIDCVVSEHIPYHKIHENGENLWSALLETGYLTKAVPEDMSLMPLRIPNREIQVVFREEVWNFFKSKIDNVFVTDLVNTLWAKELERAEAIMNQILEATLSFYHEYHEYSYHLILDGFFTGCGYRVQSERETGYGRSDLIILDPARNRSMILELKHVQKEEEMEDALKEASSQIIKKKYASSLVYEGYTTRLQYGMAFYDKRSKISSVME